MYGTHNDGLLLQNDVAGAFWLESHRAGREDRNRVLDTRGSGAVEDAG